MKILIRHAVILILSLGLAYACGFDETLRAYLDAHFWLPFSKHAPSFEKRGVRRVSAAFAGMVKAAGDSPLDRLRSAYQEIPQRIDQPAASFDPAPARQALAAARADTSLSRREREEVDLIDAKIDMRVGQPDPLLSAKKKLEAFLKTARTSEFLSEARGWIAHIDYVLGDQTAAGKIYLDELNRNGSNLSRETVLNSLKINYGYDGGAALLAHLDEYFDTPEHASFAIQMVTNPHWPNYQGPHYSGGIRRPEPPADATAASYPRIQALLERHRDLLQSQTGSSALALLSMRTALRMGDPSGALKIAGMIPSGSAIRSDPDLEWMLAASHFLAHDFAAAEQPLLDLFQSARSSTDQKAGAAYALCGVYFKLKNPVEQIHYALQLRSLPNDVDYLSSGNEDGSVYFAPSGWDLNLLLESEAPIEALQAFLTKYPNAPKIRLVNYSLAVRLARENRYDEAAEIYQLIGAARRASRMRELAGLYKEAERTDLPAQQIEEAKFNLASFLAAHPDGIYFNDSLWGGFQRYALYADSESGLTREEHETAVTGERKLKDDQEERWRAYLILRDVVRDAGKTELGRKAAQLAVRCVRGINTDRFGRADELAKADIDLSTWLRAP